MIKRYFQRCGESKNGDQEPAPREAQWMGRPVTVVHVKSARATFTINRPEVRNMEQAWEMSLKAAKDLQSGKEVGRIGYYGPDISIKRNVIDSISGFGYLYPKGN